MEILNAVGAFGEDDLESRVFSLRRPFRSSVTNATIPAKTVVSITTDGKIATATTDGNNSLAIGITNEAIEPEGTGVVTIYGAVESVPISGSVSAGNLLVPSATTAGRVAAATTTQAAASGDIIGAAIADGSAANGTVDVWFFKS